MAGYIGTKAALLSTTTASVGGDSTVGGDLTVDTDTLYVDSANNRVGIGNTSPTQALDVTGDIITSGGVYLGGTGAANYLDDYEEGTWTPDFGPSKYGSFADLDGYSNAVYTKIGDTVHCEVYLTASSPSAANAAIDRGRIGGLPFTAFSGIGQQGHGTAMHVTSTGGNDALLGICGVTGTEVNIWAVSEHDTVASLIYINVGFTYKAA